MLSPHIFRAYDIRGIYQTDFDEKGAENIGKGYGTYLRKLYSVGDADPPSLKFRRTGLRPLQIALGRDGRNSGKALQDAFEKGVLTTGIDVVRIGMIPSPLLYFAICNDNLDGGVAITASHNPKQYNGFKLQKHGAHAICGDSLQEILHIIEHEDFFVSEEEGSVHEHDFKTSYFEKVASLADINISSNTPKIVIDAGNGITGNYAPEFFRNAGCEVVELFCDVDGNFPNHDADPEREENLQDLKQKVLETKADFGLAFDGDGDRVGLLDSQGNHYSADLLLLLLSRDLLSRNPGASIVFDLKSTQVLKEEIERLGGKALMCKTGHSFVEEMMEKSGALLGGEVSGHLFFSENYYGVDDALIAAYKLIALLWNSGKPIKEHLSNLPKTFVTPEIKVKILEEHKFEVIEKIVQHFIGKYPDALTIDGVRIEFGEGAWGIVRASNTSPYLTTRFEARSQKRLDEIQQVVFDHLGEYEEISGIPKSITSS